MPNDILTGRKPGYLACIDNTPPLIFRFQINPEIMTEKRSYKYDAAQQWGAWQFDNPSSIAGGASTAGLAVAGFAAAVLLPGASSFPGLTGALNNIKNFASALVNTRPLEAKEGEQRTFAIDFALDARLADVLDEGDHYGGSIEPDLFVLRSFVNPGMDLIDFGKWAIGGFQRSDLKNVTPPLCSLFMVGLSVTCVMTDLQIKVTALRRRRDADPRRRQRHLEGADAIDQPDHRILPAQHQRVQELRTQELRHGSYERDADPQPFHLRRQSCLSSTPRAISACRSTM